MVQNNSAEFNRTGARAVTIDNAATKESLLGTEHPGRVSNVSWGAVVAGVITFLALTVLLSLITAGIGLGGSGIGAGIWSIISLVLALAAGGYVAGALSVRSGLLHGFLTWATSLIVALALTVWLSASLLGVVGGMVNSISQAASGTDITQVVEDAQGAVDDSDVENAQDQADDVMQDVQQNAEKAADTAQASAWWGFAGLLLGAIVAALSGMLGVRSVLGRERVHETAATGTAH